MRQLVLHHGQGRLDGLDLVGHLGRTVRVDLLGDLALTPLATRRSSRLQALSPRDHPSPPRRTAQHQLWQDVRTTGEQDRQRYARLAALTNIRRINCFPGNQNHDSTSTWLCFAFSMTRERPAFRLARSAAPSRRAPTPNANATLRVARGAGTFRSNSMDTGAR